MSIHVSSEVLKHRIGSPTRKSVLKLFADKASDDGTGIWASKQTMADELELTKQTMHNTINSLLADKLIHKTGTRKCQNGYTVEYAINLKELRRLPFVNAHADDRSNCLTGQTASPVKQFDPTSQAALPDQSNSLTQTVLEPSYNHIPPTPQQAGGRKIRSSIPDSWSAPAANDLPDNARACAEMWPSKAYAAQAEAFEQFHRGSGSRRADWDALWSAWVIKNHEAVMRCQKAGVAPPAPRPKGVPRPLAPVAVKADESKDSARLHAALKSILGANIYGQWFEVCALLLADDGLTIVAPSTFVKSWIEDRMPRQLERALNAVDLRPDFIRIVAQKAPQKGTSKSRKSK